MNIKKQLQSLLTMNAIEVNHYFASNFWDEYQNEDEDVLEFLTEKFFNIDMQWHDNKDIEKTVRKTLNDAIQMIERKQKGRMFVSVKIKFNDYNKVENLLPDIFPNISFFIKEADHNLKKLGFCDNAPCIVTFNLDYSEFEEMLDTLNDIEIEAFNMGGYSEPSNSDPAYQKYLKYGCLYEILFSAERVYNPIGKVKYVGKSFGVESLTDGNTYLVVGIEHPFIRVIDDSEEDYLYSITVPSSLEDPSLCGKWEIVEDPTGVLKEYIHPSRL